LYWIRRIPLLGEQRRIVAYLDGLQAKVNALRELRPMGREELSALMASVLDRKETIIFLFKGIDTTIFSTGNPEDANK